MALGCYLRLMLRAVAMILPPCWEQSEDKASTARKAAQGGGEHLDPS